MCKKSELQILARGYVIFDLKDDPGFECINFTAYIIIIDLPKRICAGYTPMVHCHTAHIPCRFTEILRKIQEKLVKL